jgi:hypothetical protein
MAAGIKMTVFWNVALHNLGSWQTFKGSYCILLSTVYPFAHDFTNPAQFVVTEYSSIRSDTMVHLGEERQSKETR